MLRIGVDIGGTFTDFLRLEGRRADVVSLKVPSTPPAFENGFRDGFERLLARLEPTGGEMALVMHGTTVSTNAVIERKGPKIAFFVTKGFRDMLEFQRMGVRNPLNIYETRTKSLIPRSMVYEVDERLLRAAAVCARPSTRPPSSNPFVMPSPPALPVSRFALLHSYTNPEHEQIIANVIRRVTVKTPKSAFPAKSGRGSANMNVPSSAFSMPSFASG